MIINRIQKCIAPLIKRGNNQVVQFYSKVVDSPKTQKIFGKFEGDELKYLAMLGIFSNVLKDILGCVLYVWQSLHNKDIPEDKRAFVASVDLANGGLMVFTQIAMFLLLKKSALPAKCFKKFFGSYFKSSELKQKVIAKVKKDINGISDTEIALRMQKMEKFLTGAFEAFVELVASTIIAKRIITPFIATPAATEIEDKFLSNKKQQKAA